VLIIKTKLQLLNGRKQLNCNHPSCMLSVALLVHDLYVVWFGDLSEGDEREGTMLGDT